MNKVFVVTSGEYSDYRIIGICSTLENAKYIKKVRAADNDIEEWNIDDLNGFPPKGTFLYQIEMDIKGKTYQIDLIDFKTEYSQHFKWFCYLGENSSVGFNVFAKNKKQAIKIANEYRIGLITNGQWTTNYDEWCKIADNYKLNGFSNE